MIEQDQMRPLQKFSFLPLDSRVQQIFSFPVSVFVEIFSLLFLVRSQLVLERQKDLDRHRHKHR
ncbi:MAG: hypothetical protein ACD_48C00383G0001 [uncultured bacterium]|nr:MAG: hypothetical protein ACD_48C00383G0001 [uncultured bacterium]